MDFSRARFPLTRAPLHADGEAARGASASKPPLQRRFTAASPPHRLQQKIKDRAVSMTSTRCPPPPPDIHRRLQLAARAPHNPLQRPPHRTSPHQLSGEAVNLRRRQGRVEGGGGGPRGWNKEKMVILRFAVPPCGPSWCRRAAPPAITRRIGPGPGGGAGGQLWVFPAPCRFETLR